MSKSSVLHTFFPWIIAASLLASPFCQAGAAGFDPDGAPHRELWAGQIEKPGLPNFHRVTDGLYRGAQPTALGLQELRRMGIKTVVNLRTLHSDQDQLVDTYLGYEHIAMTAWSPEREEIVRFLQIVTDPDRTPVFVHCRHGADRTGLLCAVYRLVVCNWTKEEAIQEMTEGGFGFHRFWVNLVQFVKDLDVSSLKRKIGSRPGDEGWQPTQQAQVADHARRAGSPSGMLEPGFLPDDGMPAPTPAGGR
jgi:protein tyrosine phosphatase (PTP) superfamily phosphohydrolase (DUF442 family)